MAIKSPIRRDDPVGSSGKRGDLADCVRHLRHPLPRVFLQRRLVLKGIHLADSSLHEEEDAAFGLGRHLLVANPERIDTDRLRRHEVQERQAPQS